MKDIKQIPTRNEKFTENERLSEKNRKFKKDKENVKNNVVLTGLNLTPDDKMELTMGIAKCTEDRSKGVQN